MTLFVVNLFLLMNAYQLEAPVAMHQNHATNQPSPYHVVSVTRAEPDLRAVPNKPKPPVFEIITTPGTDDKAIKTLLLESKVDPKSLYTWKNHYVIYNKISDLNALRNRLRRNFPGTQVKIYNELVYKFNRDRCDDKQVTSAWDHILLTADLVANPKLQAEYVAYHATQFEKWPELSKGFCNAGFQQLLVLRNGRQLMLIISIPKGESLDKLNPLTTKDNPRVDEWNKIMAKYQQGIQGTAKGETWVFLKPIE